MSYFIYDSILQPGQTVPFEGEEAHHLLKSRRLRIGELFALQDPSGQRFSARLTDIHRNTATIDIIEILSPPPPSVRAVTLLQAAVKDKANEWIIQKATELGVAAVVFFASDFGTVPQHTLSSPKTQARWERIAWEACKQCDRQFPPLLVVERSLSSLLEGQQNEAESIDWILDPQGEQTIGASVEKIGKAERIRLLVGPEGGLSPEEVFVAREAGFLPIRLGENILRAETAALAACTMALLG